jgi:outer membrane biosynthesis protein TonB
MCLIQCGGLWFANGKFGVTWRLVQCIVQKPKASILGQGTCFMNIDQAARDALAAPVPNSNATDLHDNDTRETHLVEDSDAEDEHDDAPATEPEHTPAPTPTPAPAPEPVKKVKRVVRKKTTD